MSLLEFLNVSYVKGGKTILKNLVASIESGDFILVVGPSGSGKTTFFKLCSHLISPTQGEITFKNQDISYYNPMELRKSIAYCSQLPYLFGDTVRENINFPFSIRKEKMDKKRVDDLFSLFHMSTKYLDEDVNNLSGGEKQRIALIRSLLFKPEILLLDEITSALDVENTKIIENVITALNRQGITILWITHDLKHSRKSANKILTIEAGKIKSLEVIK